MAEFLLGHYAYWFIIILLVIGLYGMLLKQNLVKKTIGLIIFQASIVLFFVAVATKRDATVPVLDPALGADPELYLNPLTHTLMLTAIVVGVAVAGVAFSLLVAIYRNYGTLDEPELLERMK
jgi:multicomponent Na+:H+ antiporter subunit C